jgi:hypothetical protein
VTSLERDNFIAFDYFSTSKIWSDKRDGIS